MCISRVYFIVALDVAIPFARFIKYAAILYAAEYFLVV